MDTIKETVNHLRPSRVPRQASVASIRLGSPSQPQTGDIETGQVSGTGNGSGSLFTRRGRANSRSNPNNDASGSSDELASPSIKGKTTNFLDATKQMFSNALSTATGVLEPAKGIVDPETRERQRVVNERAEYDQQVVDLLDVIGEAIITTK